MPKFMLHLQKGNAIEPNDLDMEFADLHQAYLEACKAIPDVARDLLAEGWDPMTCAFILCDAQGSRLMEVPFTEILPPFEWRRRRATRGPHTGVRSTRARDELALISFRRMFAAANAGCVLLTPELQVREINQFGAKHSHVDPEAIRDTSILEIFSLAGEPKESFRKFWSLARTGVNAELIDMPYLVLDKFGQTASGWWNARTWPIFDDNDILIGLVEWAEPFTSPTAGGRTRVRVSPKTFA